MTAPGVRARAESTLVDRALAYLRDGPAPSPAITRDILGIPHAPGAIAERLTAALLGSDPRVRRDHTGKWRLADPRPALTALGECAFAVVDVETTGSLAGRGDRITEIAILGVQGGAIHPLVDSLVNPGRPISYAVTRVTGITDDMVRDRPTFAELADEVLTALAGRVFVAHNVGFDWGFVSREVVRARGLRLDGPRLCTVRLARKLVAGLKHRGLDSLARYYGIEIEARHRAGGDAAATAQVLLRLLAAAEEQGATTLEELLDLATRGRGRRRRGRRRASPTVMDDL